MVPGRLPSGSDWPAVLLHHVDVPVGTTEEEPAKAFHARVVEQVVCPDEVADQLDPRGRKFFTMALALFWITAGAADPSLFAEPGASGQPTSVQDKVPLGPGSLFPESVAKRIVLDGQAVLEL